MPQAKPKSPVKHATRAAENHLQVNLESLTEPTEMGDPRALLLLAELRCFQAKVPKGAALAWERATFAEAFLDPEPLRRVQAFLSKAK